MTETDPSERLTPAYEITNASHSRRREQRRILRNPDSEAAFLALGDCALFLLRRGERRFLSVVFRGGVRGWRRSIEI